MTLSTRDARAFVERWALVAEAEREELRRQPLEEKLAQLAVLVESARALGWETTDDAEVEGVRRRWCALVAKHGG